MILLAIMLLSAVGMVSAAETRDAAFDGRIIFLHTNDVHGEVSVTDVAGNARLGIASVSQMKRDLEEMGSYVLLLDAGDFAQGTELVRHSEGVSAVEFMTTAGYDAACVGEAELAYGYPHLRTLAEHAGFPLLGANVTEPDADTAALQSQAVFTAPDGTKIGVFGLVMPEVKALLYPAQTEGLDISGGEDRIACAQAQVTQLKEAGCDLIVCVGHLGTDAGTVIEAVDGIDLFLNGHTEAGGAQQIGDTLLVSAAADLEQIGMVVYDGASFRSTLYDVTGYDGVDAAVEELIHTEEAGIAAWYAEAFAEAAQTLGVDDTRESTFGDLVTDAMFRQAQQIDAAADAALIESGSLLSALPAGTLTRAAVRDALAETSLHLLDVTGAQLLVALEDAAQAAPAADPGFLQVRGIRAVVDTNIPYDPAQPGSRVEILSVGGADFDPAAVYTLAVSGALAEAFPDAARCYDLHIPVADAVIAYVTEELGGEIGSGYAETKQRITVICIPFTDVELTSWYFDAVQYVYEHGLMNGVDETHFAPAGTMTRGMMVTMLHRLSGSPAAEGSAADKFTDVPDDAWYAEAVAWAVETGITQGMGDGTFQPDGILSRQQMATFFYRHAQVYGDVSAANGYELAYQDIAEIADWAHDAVAYCTAVGLMQGVENNNFAPNADANRAMGATILMRFAKLETDG